MSATNPADPLHKTDVAAPNAQELFGRLGEVCRGFPHEAVLAAAVNVIVNCVRQKHAKRSGAEKEFDELTGKAKNILLERHYDLAGNRRNIFPFDQIIEMPYHKEPNKW
jgi:hypothetical protein